MVKRFERWPLLLSDYLKCRKAIPFKWGDNDCALFAADAVWAMSGCDLAADFRTYDSEAAAQTILAAHGGIEAMITRALAVEPHTDYRRVHRGDIALTAEHNAVAVVDDTGRRLAIVTPDGLRRLPISHGFLFWSW